jgi:tripeptidyl-peptidase-1
MKAAVIVCLLLALTQAELLHSVSSTEGWRAVERAAPHEEVYMSFAVKQSNLDIVDRLFWEVSNPKSELYGQYLSFEEVGELIKNEESTQAVLEFLNQNGASEIDATPYGEFITATMPVSTAEAVFQADFHKFVHNSYGDEYIVKTTGYVIPEALVDHITHVDHIMYFPLPDNRGPIISSTRATGTVDPSFLYSYYGIDPSTSSGQATQSIFAALGQSYSDTDLSQFQSKNSLPNDPVDTVIGDNDPSACDSNANNCIEANLDVQYIMSVAQGVDTTFWRITRFTADPFAEWTKELDSSDNVPMVHSISYGGPESNKASMSSFNTEMQKYGLRGVTVMVSSGDDGAVSSSVRTSTAFCGYSPSFPASSPYVTAVGATQGPEAGNDEISCSSDTGGLITSGGGFSTYFDAPSYQSSVISDYLNNVSPKPASGYNADGRGIPDVAFLGHNYNVIVGGTNYVVSGTSASSPAFAGLVSLANDARLAAGKSPLGFLNQALYGMDSSVFKDITSGNNKCAAGNFVYHCCDQGYYAYQGWDPLTGLGVPVFDKFMSALTAL